MMGQDSNIIKMTNRTGVTLVGNEAVIIDSENDKSVVFANLLTTTTRVCGVVITGGDNLIEVTIQLNGYATCIANGTIQRGDMVRVDYLGTPAGRIITDNSPTNNLLGRAITSATIGQNVEIILST